MAANVLLEIATKTDFASLAALKDMVVGTVGAVRDWIAVNERFVQQMNNATISLNQFETNVANLVDTGLAYQKSTELTNAGLDATAEQYASVAKAATIFGKTTGDVNGEFQRLIEALKTGRTEGLRKYGIEIERTGHRQRDFDAAVEQLSKKFKNQTVELETTGEVIDALSNNWGTLQGQILKLNRLEEPTVGMFKRINDEIAEASKNLDKMIDALDRYEDIRKEREKTSDFDLASPYSGMDDARRRLRMKRMIDLADRSRADIDQFQLESVSDFLAGRGEFATNISDISSDDAQFAIERMLKQGQFTTKAPSKSRSRRGGSGKTQRERELDLLNEALEKAQVVAQQQAQLELDLINQSIGSTQRQRLADRSAMEAGFEGRQGDIDYQRELLQLKMASGEVTSNMYQQQIDLLQQEWDLKQNQIQQLGYDEDSPEYRQLRLEQERIAHEQNMLYKKQEIQAWYEQATAMDYAKLAFTEYVDSLSTGGLIASTSIGMIESAVGSMFNAIFDAKKGFFEALSFMIRDQAISAAAQAFSIGLLQTVRANEWFAMPFGAGSAQGAIYSGSAAQAFATSAVLLGIAGASHGVGSLLGKISGHGNKGAADSAAGAYSSGGSSSQRGTELGRMRREPEKVEVTITLKDGADGFVEAMYTQNEQRAKRGAAHFSTSEGF